MSSLLVELGGPREWLSLFAAIGTLSLAVIVAFHRRREGRGPRTSASAREVSSPLARPLSGLCFVLFGWNFSVVAGHALRAHGLPGIEAFGQIDALFTALSPPLVFEVVLAFVGVSRRTANRAARAAAWVLYGVLALVALGGLGSPALRAASDGVAWMSAFFAGWVVSFVYGVAVLVRHLQKSHDPREKARARIVLAALTIGGAFSMSDTARGFGLPLPYLGAIGTLLAAALLATVVVRFELLDRSISAKTAVYAIVMIAAFAAVYLVVLVAFAGKLSVQIFSLCALTLLGAAATRELAVSLADARARSQRLALLGRFSAQMAHDIRGPLTALLGAVDVLEGANDETTKSEFLGLVTEQAKRVAAIVDRYDRMARIEPQPTIVRVNDVVQAVARAHAIQAADLELAPDDPECDADRALVESALENVVRNAVEAAGAPKLVRISTKRAARTVVIAVDDEGPGMDARVLERAPEDFFTTKAEGSGLGLTFAKRVLEAHAGSLTLRSEPHKGTRVELVLPARQREQDERSETRRPK